jgi:hypothetical protein
MKKSILLAAVILIAAQLSSFGQMKVTAGYLNNEIKASESGFNFSLSGDGFYVGILGQSPFGDNPSMSFEPGAMFDYISYKIAGETEAMYFLRVPLHVRYDFAFGSKNTFFVNAGPGITFGLGGDDEPFGDDGFKRFDLNLGIEAGLTLTDQLDVRLGYDWGLLSMVSEVNAHRKGLHVGIAFAF